MKHGSNAVRRDGVVFCAMDEETASEIVSLLNCHVAGDVMAYDAPVFKFLKALSALNLPHRHLYNDIELSKTHGHSVVFRQAPEDIEEE